MHSRFDGSSWVENVFFVTGIFMIVSVIMHHFRRIGSFFLLSTRLDIFIFKHKRFDGTSMEEVFMLHVFLKIIFKFNHKFQVIPCSN